MGYLSHDIDKMIKRKHDDEYWAFVLSSCNVNKHPEELDGTAGRLQYFILLKLSDNPDDLPIDQSVWEDWYNWHVEHGTEL